MKILLVTGRKASEQLREIVVSTGMDISVYVCATDVAALLTVNNILKELSGMDLSKTTLILVPGNAFGDAKIITEKLGIDCFKGPRNLADIPMVLKKLAEKKVRLSTTLAADIVLEFEIKKEAGKELKKVYGIQKDFSIKIGKKKPVYLGTGISHVVAEIIDAPMLSEKELKKRAKYYVGSGAEVIDIGMCAGVNNSKKIAGIVKTLRSVVDVPLSIDSLDESEILAGLDEGIDLVLSLDETNRGLQGSIDVPYVVIPRDKDGVVPRKAEDRIKIIQRLLENSKKDVIVDLILSPLNYGFTESVKAYSLFRETNPKVPLLLGAGNVTELFDVDSIGVNGLIAGIASELSADLILTTEASRKSAGSVRELRKASEMMYLSKIKGQAPKDLGLDLLVLKDKREMVYPVKDVKLKTVSAKGPYKTVLEDSEFEIYLTDKINVICYRKKKPVLHLTGLSASDLYNEILKRKLLKRLDHSAYLGKELEKAEIALRLGKNYVQDRELFPLRGL